MKSMTEQVLEEAGYLQKGWVVENESVLICPHGYGIEYDGACPEGCVSPLREMGLI